MENLPGFLLAWLALAGSPGPSTLSCAAAGAAFGVRGAFAYVSGLVFGMVLVIAIVASGLIGLFLALPGAVPVVTALAAAYILYLAWRIATAPPLADNAHDRPRPSFAGGVFLQLVNPKAYAVVAAAYSGFVLAEASPALDAALKVTAMMAVVVAVAVFWVNTGSALTRLFRDPAANRAINIGFAVVLVASVAFALVL